MIYLEKIEEKRNELALLEQRFLRDRGWQHTSSTIGSRWRWCKTFDGEKGEYKLNQREAIAVECLDCPNDGYSDEYIAEIESE